MGQFLQRVLHGFRKVARGIELCLRNQKGHVPEGVDRGREHGGSWQASGPEGQRFIPLSMTRVHCNSIKNSGEKHRDLSGCKGHSHWFKQNHVMFLISGLLPLAASSARPLIVLKWKCPDNPMLPLSIFVVFIFNWSCKGFYSADLSHFSKWHLLPWLAFYSLSSHTNSTSSSYQCAHQNSSAYVGNSLFSDLPLFCATFWNACTFDWMTVIFNRH